MPENNQILSVEGQLVGMPLAGPESFSAEQLAYLKRALGVDETVLWENTDGVSSTNFPLTLSESISNFERVKIFWRPWSSNYTVSEKFTTDTQYFLEADWGSVASDSSTYHFLCCISINGTSATFNKQIFQQWGTTTINNNSTNFRIYKIVGIHRIAGGN